MSLRHLLAASAFLAATGLPALAQQGPIPSRSLTCAQLQALVQRQGRVLISTAPHIYATYVNNCAPRDIPSPGYVPARDTPQCVVGYTCLAK
ncbi:hypothetical protein [Chelatococcus composti]|jgi:hypothetical protein|uniref:Uncharacterized protein n=1 Tax=Chelatococcus composti TaxID=1743235 RepID=A0A841KDK0_9HYPH|nr:hypothetical protein [Chelatococcus composti]MBB6168026.1 hypothetical protein [Chelatococcus composti]MBS7734783.1 hypothetical protein [Chelatococcus composti]PZN45442.1 MAG: hypothetical protein DIU59_02035 [Pseudomonadota bacterium]GGG34100.1 hypothetical protein GCM10008026_13530 [Chelatococcus composti]